MITFRQPIADYRHWPFGKTAPWGWRDIVCAPVVFVMVMVGLVVILINEKLTAHQHPERK